jgi:two-component system response regulator
MKNMKNEEVEILLIEDNPSDAELAIRALRKGGITNNIIHLIDGVSAIDFLFGKGEYEGRNVNNRPKLILLDLKMPKLNGMEVLKIVKGDELTKKIPVVVLTSSKENPDIEISYSLGANSYIVKPVDFDGFVKAVSEVGLYWLLLNQPIT